MGEKACRAGENYAVITHRCQYRVIYGDTDAMGIVYYANYLRIFEFGRLELFRSMGVTVHVPEVAGYVFPAVEAHCRYITAAEADDLLTVETTLDAEKRSAFRFDYRILREEDGEQTLVATGHSIHACMDDKGRVVRPPRYLRDRIEESCAFAEKSRIPQNGS
ncbi:MAG: acyl-CoA thioesterase [Desulfatibacillaceae bacterium]